MNNLKDLLIIEQNSVGIAERLKEFRSKLKLTKDNIKEATSLDDSLISKMELQKRTPSADVLFKLSKVYNLSIDWLVHGRGNMFMINENHPLNNLDNEYLELIESLKALPNQKRVDLIQNFKSQIQLHKKK